MQPPIYERPNKIPPPSDGIRGVRLVCYEYCISLIIITLRCPTRVVRLAPGSTGLLRGLPYTIISLLLGWWVFPGDGFTPCRPFGPI